MDLQPTGHYLVRVVRLRRATNGAWYLTVAGPDGSWSVPLAPLTLVVRLWQTDSGLLRGTIHMPGTDLVVPIHSNANLEALVRVYLATAAGPGPEGVDN